MNKPTDVYFFENGNTFVSDGINQIPELQEPWILTFAKFLESNGIDPMSVKYHFLNHDAELFKTSEGDYNWRIK